MRTKPYRTKWRDMAFRDQPFGERFHTLGDIAEDVYQQVTPLGSTTRFGFRRPEGLRFSMLPEVVRHMPDFITPTHLVEVVGLGRDGLLKSIKTTKFEALKMWSKIAKMTGLMGLVIFVWNSAEHQFLIVSWENIVKEVTYSKRKHGVQSFESDGNQYYQLEWDRLKDAASTIGSWEDDE